MRVQQIGDVVPARPSKKGRALHQSDEYVAIYPAKGSLRFLGRLSG